MSQSHLSPPYPPTAAALGGLPTVGVDAPICSVLLVVYMIGAASHMTIFQINHRRGHKFLISGMLFGFCMSRIVTMIMRIVWATHPMNVRVAIASNVFVSAGVLLLFIANLVFAQRIVRAWHPNFGWHAAFHHAFTALYVLIVLTLAMLITAVIQSFYTLNGNTKRIDRDIQLYGQTFYCVIAFLPIPMIFGGLLLPRKTHTEKFGQGRFRSKLVILLTSSFLLCLGACFRAGVNYAGGKRPIRHPAGYQSKACFYIFNFVVEIIVLYLYVIIRIDKRFWVPDHSKKAGDYARGHALGHLQSKDMDKQTDSEENHRDIILTEEEVFDDKTPEEVARMTTEEKDVEMVNGPQNRSAQQQTQPSTQSSPERVVNMVRD